MALHFSANQYEKEFHPKRLQNWEVPKVHREHPRRLNGFTQPVATGRGHLNDKVPKSDNSPWGTFVGTWDMPGKIPGNNITNPTARSDQAMEQLRTMKMTCDEKMLGKTSQGCKIDMSKQPKATFEDRGIQTSAGISGERSGAKMPTPPPATSASPKPFSPEIPLSPISQKDKSPSPAPTKTPSPVQMKSPTPTPQPLSPSPSPKPASPCDRGHSPVACTCPKRSSPLQV